MSDDNEQDKFDEIDRILESINPEKMEEMMEEMLSNMPDEIAEPLREMKEAMGAGIDPVTATPPSKEVVERSIPFVKLIGEEYGWTVEATEEHPEGEDFKGGPEVECIAQKWIHNFWNNNYGHPGVMFN